MRTLIVTDSMIWNAETEYALSVARAEAAMGFDVTVAAPDGSVAFERAPRDVRLERLPGAEFAKSPADLIAACRWIAGYAQSGPQTVIHSSRSPAHLAAALVKTPSAKLVHLRGGAAQPRSGPLNRYLYRRRTDAVVASSGRIASWVRERLGVPDDRVFQFYLPIDVGVFSAGPGTIGAGSGPDRVRIRAEFGVGESAPLVVNVARLAPVKGHDVLIDAWARVRREHPTAVLLLAGESWSGQPERLLARAEGLGVSEGLRVAGRRDDVPALLAAADVCVCSSVGSEENSRAVSEYMAASRAVVATRVGVIPELVADGETGLLTEPSDADALAGALARLLGDPARAVVMGESGRKRARELLSWESFAAGLAHVLTTVGIPAEGAIS